MQQMLGAVVCVKMTDSGSVVSELSQGVNRAEKSYEVSH